MPCRSADRRNRDLRRCQRIAGARGCHVRAAPLTPSPGRLQRGLQPRSWCCTLPRMRVPHLVPALLALAAACDTGGGAATSVDAADRVDAPPALDAAVDAGDLDGGPTFPLPGFGAITGDCHVID